MDKVKAIKVLKPLVDSYVDYANITMKEEDDDIVDALEMAIEALKALDVPDTNVGDMISRQMAIDLFPDDDLEYDTKGGYVAPHLARRMICELPFVHPDHVADVSKKVDGDDCISRKTALDAFGLSEKTRKYGGDHSGYDTRMLYEIQDTLENLPAVQPELDCALKEFGDCSYSETGCSDCAIKEKIRNALSIQPERAEGEWIPFDVEYECSHCGIILQFNEGTPKDNNANFCPNCGADMRGGEND